VYAAPEIASIPVRLMRRASASKVSSSDAIQPEEPKLCQFAGKVSSFTEDDVMATTMTKTETKPAVKSERGGLRSWFSRDPFLSLREELDSMLSKMCQGVTN
jgi:hypothetical protein